MDVSATFVAACEALENPATSEAAGKHLESLRSSSAAIPLAKSVIETSPSQLAQFHAILLIRHAVIRQWPGFTLDDRASTRDYCLSIAAQRCASMPKPILSQLLVAVAVMWKRGWLEEAPASRGRLFEHVMQLFGSSDAVHQELGARLCLTLVQEMSAQDSGKATALGQPQEFHKKTAAAFAQQGLRECFSLCSKLLLSKVQAAAASGPGGLTLLCSSGGSASLSTLGSQGAAAAANRDAEVLQILLDTMVSCLTWDFTGNRGGGGVAARVQPGSGWRELLADGTVANGVFALYNAARVERMSQIAYLARQLLALLCGLEGEVFPNKQSSCAHGYRMVTGLLEFVRNPLHALIPAMLQQQQQRSAAASRSALDEAEYYHEADAEATDVLAALSTAVRGYTLAGLASIGDITQLLSLTSSMACGLLDQINGAANSLLGALEGEVDKARVAAAKKHLEELLEGRYEDMMGVVDAALELWSSMVFELESGDNAQSLLQVAPAARSHAAGFYERLVLARLSMGSALMRCDVDDFNPFEDESQLRDHLDTMAFVGRFVAQHSSALLTRLLANAHAKLHGLTVGYRSTAGTGPAGSPTGAGNGYGGSPFIGSPHQLQQHRQPFGAGSPSKPLSFKEREVRINQTYEECWWLAGYASHLLSDEPQGESPSIPLPLNSLSTASVAANASAGYEAVVAADPVVALSSELLRLAQFECARVLADPTMEMQSPLQWKQLLTALSRWARTYLFCKPTTSAASSSSKAPVSQVLLSAYGPQPFTQQPSASSPSAVLNTIPAQAGIIIGGRSVLELILQTAVAGLGVWGGQGSDDDVAEAALALLRSLCYCESIAKHAALSPTWCLLAETVLGVISGEISEDSANSASVSMANQGQQATPFGSPDAWRSSLPMLAQLPPEHQGKLITILLSITRYVAAETGAAYDTALEACLEGENALDLVSMKGSGAGPADVVARWRRYYMPFVQRLHARLALILSSPQLQSTPNDSRVIRELDRLLCMHTGMVRSSSGMPDAWHLQASVACLVACPPLIHAYKGTGQLCLRALQFVKQFLDVESDALAAPEQVRNVFGTITAVFQAYAKYHAGVVRKAGPGVGAQAASLADGHSGLKSSSAGAAALASEDEESEYQDILCLLQILEKIADKEALDLAAPVTSKSVSTGTGGFGAASPSAAAASGVSDALPATSEAMLVGLAFLVPLMSQSLMGYPGLVSAYMTVVCYIMTRHPASVARMDPGLFSVFISNLEAGIAHYDVSIVRSALEAVDGMGLYHSAARRKGGHFASVLDLTTQLQRIPDLFVRFARSVLQLTLGASAPSQDLINPAGSALLAMIVCDFEGYQRLVSGLLAAQPDPSMASRLAAEFSTMTAAACRTPGVAPVLDRPTRRAFEERFQPFVAAVRGITTIL